MEEIHQGFIENLSRISEFWGYPRAMGALYGALYLSPAPLSLDELIPLVGITKGAISTNIRALEQLGMVHKQVKSGDRRDYYLADTDFWKITKTILERRQKPEFDKALNDVSLALKNVRSLSRSKPEAQLTAFYEARLSAMESFFHTVDNVVAVLLQMERLRAEGVRSLLRIPAKSRSRKRIT
jgi:DNA-binding transcriptional regulator GbsR (MarR family)